MDTQHMDTQHMDAQHMDAQHMDAQHWRDTLKLLCIMILADEKVYEEEVDSFKKAAVALRDSINPKLMLTEHMAQEWFVVHRDEIKIEMSPLYHENITDSLLENLKTLPERKTLLLALMKIALSDGHKASEENAMLKRASCCWGLDMTG